MSVRSDLSETDRSEILAPIPRRHHILQTTESRRWLGTPPLSQYSPPASPLSAATTPPAPNRLTGRLSVNSLAGSDARRSSISQSHSGQVAHKDDEARRTREGWRSDGWVRVILWERTPCSVTTKLKDTGWELTIHLPVLQWYTYDLQYWGLDYPPLTAYISWLCGIVGSWIDPSWFALDKSRGIETPGSKVYMRSSVLALDTLIYVPALLMFTRTWQGTRSVRTQNIALIILLLQPALLLIDFGHFQYNSVMLGLTLFAMNLFATGHDLLGAICFVLSLGFKQMALYYAPAVGSYLLGKCLYLGPAEGSRLFIRLAMVTIATFVLMFLPFLPPFAPLWAIYDPIARIFPFNRGLFEDKVANFWCATNVVLKWRLWASQGVLVKLSTALTALGFLPSVAGLLHAGYKLQLEPGNTTPRKNMTPTPLLPLLPYALLTSSLSFFLFSFQVHEKAILLPLLPATLLLSSAAPEQSTFELGMLFSNVAVFSMWPLLKRDGLGVQYFASVLWNRLIGYNPFTSKPTTLLRWLSLAIYSACAALHLLELLVAPPARFPDLFPVLNVLVSTPVFVLTWLWSIKRGVEVGWALGGLGTRADKAAKPSSSAPGPNDALQVPVQDGRGIARSTGCVR
ncbi:Dolichyl pyrophosphate Man9GlcNAc2 alpha-1,3-glucosyltransferase [Grifola frondosa]|uniref:Alpha-1,3-glucosyltransferase n=1 Tax=Grifola frondosa TaxID=5627 RepID=A0A1C7M335_GRIFR|nr:Dolichyl pyrophosphate Man9GlcNAc2 alpha-1,3-glucosyltransferase [Grifola frondosa]